MRRYVPIILIVFFISIAAFKSNDIENNERYFMLWDSYLGFSTNESPTIDLSYIRLKNNKNKIPTENIKEISFISDKGEIKTEYFESIDGESDDNYILSTLYTNLPKLPPGIYNIEKLKIKNSLSVTQFYNIGNWEIEIKEDLSSDILLSKTSFISNSFERYFTEIQNISNSEIQIDNLYFKLNNLFPDIVISTSNSFNESTTSSDRSVPVKQIKFFNFEFSLKKTDTNSESFIAIRPFLIYSKNGNKYLATTDTMIYSPTLTHQEILNIINSNKY